ncbi:membrane bound O-acyl transferase family-domain-containing protein [Mycena alexandri]|uniref:Membrane bound O-acyl transferase family-domain-containing protein n=1 Tax=Mycena alexandri TaxID=1745969 RepID=A0AAD6SVE4_9AGAR|nr:membrane bound O-acyl transferase family-domain-containing protein [Mycena alexandri]
MKKITLDRNAVSQITYLSSSFLFFNLLALVVKPSPYRRLLFLPLLLMSPYLLSLSTGYPTMDYCIATAWFTYLFAASDFILLTDVQRELRIMKPSQRADEPIEHASLRRRIAWALKLFTSTTGVGWEHQPRYPLRPSPSIPRRIFVRDQLLQALLTGATFEGVNYYFHTRHPSLYAGGPSLTSFGWLWRYQTIWAWSVPLAASSICVQSLSAAYSVGTGASGPEDWPPFMGSFALAWSVRNFWGRTWHQSMRRFLSAHGKFVAHKMLRLQPGTKASAYAQLYVAFLVSGTMHYLPEYMALRHWGGGALWFFLLQAVAITVEECAQGVGRWLGITGGWKCKLVGYFWVWSWFAFCLPIWQDPLLHTGVFEEVRYSVIAIMRERRAMNVSAQY